jgi:hypothetical protein
MGLLSNPLDNATYLSKIQQGIDGNWLVELRHTPESHDPGGFYFFYLALGHLASLIGVSPVVIFHLARIASSYLMFFSLYELGASIWQRQRPRRWFFVLAAMGSGLGWLGLFFYQGDFAPDLTVPEAYPFFAAYTNPHFPLTLACISLMMARLIEVFRPGYQEAPNPNNGGLLIIFLSIVLAMISPIGISLIGAVAIVYTLIQGYMTRQLPFHEARWTSMAVLPALPFAVYYLALFRSNELLSGFNEQNITASPPLPLFFMGFGLLLILAGPAIWRALRHFEADGDRLMLIWLLLSSVATYLPFPLQRRMMIALLIPIVYFAVRAMEDYWFKLLKDRWRMPALVMLFVFILPSHVLTILAPLAFTVFNQEAGADTSLLLGRDYVEALDWLHANSQRDEVLLASPSVSLWIPAQTHLRPVYGHPFETVPGELRLQQVRAFYRGEDCQSLFDPTLPFQVTYIFWGEQEDEVGLIQEDEDNIKEIMNEVGVNSPDELEGLRLPTANVCREELEARANLLQSFGSISLYQLEPRQP